MSDGRGGLVAVASNGAIFAATGWNPKWSHNHLPGRSNPRSTCQGNLTYKVVADGNTVYMGTETDTDLKVIEASRL